MGLIFVKKDLNMVAIKFSSFHNSKLLKVQICRTPPESSFSKYLFEIKCIKQRIYVKVNMV